MPCHRRRSCTSGGAIPSGGDLPSGPHLSVTSAMAAPVCCFGKMGCSKGAAAVWAGDQLMHQASGSVCQQRAPWRPEPSSAQLAQHVNGTSCKPSRAFPAHNWRSDGLSNRDAKAMHPQNAPQPTAPPTPPTPQRPRSPAPTASGWSTPPSCCSQALQPALLLATLCCTRVQRSRPHALHLTSAQGCRSAQPPRRSACCRVLRNVTGVCSAVRMVGLPNPFKVASTCVSHVAPPAAGRALAELVICGPITHACDSCPGFSCIDPARLQLQPGLGVRPSSDSQLGSTRSRACSPLLPVLALRLMQSTRQSTICAAGARQRARLVGRPSQLRNAWEGSLLAISQAPWRATKPPRILPKPTSLAAAAAACSRGHPAGAQPPCRCQPAARPGARGAPRRCPRGPPGADHQGDQGAGRARRSRAATCGRPPLARGAGRHTRTEPSLPFNAALLLSAPPCRWRTTRRRGSTWRRGSTRTCTTAASTKRCTKRGAGCA